MDLEDPKFESRKKDHIVQSLQSVNQVGLSPSSEIQLFHKALPEINFDEVNLNTSLFESFNKKSQININAPIFVSSMTAGHEDGQKINYTIAKACQKMNWLFAVGSQRKQLTQLEQDQEWQVIKEEFPGLNLVGNIGVSQLISFGPEKVLKLAESLNAKAMFIHCNPLQEVLQPEGTPQFKNGLASIKALCEISPIPIIVKETGCGFDKQTLLKLFSLPSLYAVDVAGYGGTHWGRIEGQRNLMRLDSSQLNKVGFVSESLVSNEKMRVENYVEASQTYANWGISTAKALESSQIIKSELKSKVNYWASGGIRTGLDIITSLSMGSEMVGLAQPILKHALLGFESLIQYMELVEYETKIGLFCTGYKDINSCRKEASWEWK